MKKLFGFLKNNIFERNAPLIFLLGITPLLGGTVSLACGLALGVSALFTLISSGAVISLVGRLIPKSVKDLSYLVIVAFFVTLCEILLSFFFPDVRSALGIYLPLLSVSGLAFSRAQASDGEKVSDAALSGLGMGLGFFAASLSMAFVRELLGSGTFFGLRIISEAYTIRALTSPFGAFLLFGLFAAAVRFINSHMAKEDGEQ
ncbi:MAG: hypothetical protein IJ299_05420 [Oscillospiraceae bacterium]|nr:hypothetical protein [Oscillospiraceae bacterium]